MENKATRDAFGDALLSLGAENKKIVVIDCDLSSPTKTAKFAEAFPERFFEFGIQEANAVSAASGLAFSGFKPFVCSFACFIASRYDQVRVSIAENNAPVVVVGTHGGLAIGKDGATHMALEDINLMRGLPNMAVLQPADYFETIGAVKYLAKFQKPAYLRLCRQSVPNINGEDYHFEFGKGVALKEGNDMAIFSTGGMVNIALDAAKEIEKQGIFARVINIHTIKPIDKEIILKAVQETRGIFVLEDHSIYGGLGTAVAEVVSENNLLKPVKRFGVKDVFGESGDPKDLYRKHELDAEGVINNLIKFHGELL